jgi:hypothetical protein
VSFRKISYQACENKTCYLDRNKSTEGVRECMKSHFVDKIIIIPL